MSPTVSPWAPPHLQWVVKVSKFCNLRCRYCYEFPFLGDPTHMTPEQLVRMFDNIARHFGPTGRRMDFVWHGGEPIVQGRAYYERIAEIQAETLGAAGVPYTNSVQTNLTVLDEDVLALFRTFFSNIGVSVDLFGDQRVNVAGRSVQDRVPRNMQRLQDEGLHFGCITVLSRLTAPHVEAIYRFFVDIDTSFRLLPIYRTGFVGQQDAMALTDREIVSALTEVVDLWFADEHSSIQVRPIQDYIVHVVRKLDGGAGYRRYYDKTAGEVVYIVDTDGSLYSNADAYDPSLRHGNVFDDAFADILRSEGYLRAVEAANGRMDTTCSTCRFHGACSGYFMGEATPEQRWANPDGRLYCGVAYPVQAYIEELLVREGVVDAERELLDEDLILSKLGADPLGEPEAFVG